MDRHDILRRLYTSMTVDVPFTGLALGDMARNPSYDAANDGTLGVPVFLVGTKKRCSSVAVLRKLGLPEVPTAEMVEALGLSTAPPVPPVPVLPVPELPTREQKLPACTTTKRTTRKIKPAPKAKARDPEEVAR
jgi:hypothetical protein